mmetsp:Transcript_12393/g.23915  ORF Transcript_12393/g.23915 Transcript_12393/m.23915 type:complete len:241 (-) Transcript_12393:306-1028(-)
MVANVASNPVMSVKLEGVETSSSCEDRDSSGAGTSAATDTSGSLEVASATIDRLCAALLHAGIAGREACAGACAGGCVGIWVGCGRLLGVWICVGIGSTTACIAVLGMSSSVRGRPLLHWFGGMGASVCGKVWMDDSWASDGSVFWMSSTCDVELLVAWTSPRGPTRGTVFAGGRPHPAPRPSWPTGALPPSWRGRARYPSSFRGALGAGRPLPMSVPPPRRAGVPRPRPDVYAWLFLLL